MEGIRLLGITKTVIWTVIEIALVDHLQIRGIMKELKTV